MATVRSLVTDALIEIGAYGQDETPTASDAQLALRWFQRQLDAWSAERQTMAIQKVVPFTMPSGTSTVTIGPGGDVDTVRPTWLDRLTYVNPGSSPAQETDVALLDPDMFAAIGIKALQSNYPQQAYYQTSLDTVLGSLFVWPQVVTDVDMVLYFPAGIGVPATLDDILLGPPGYQEAYVYQLAERLLTPFAVQNPTIVGSVRANSERAFARMKRPNMQPGQLGLDPALVPTGGGYDVYSDTYRH